MTSFVIKIIAVITMVIDHIGFFFFPQILVFRVIGRLAFPLFAWLIANGAHYTSNINRYLARIFWFAVVSQVPFMLVDRQIDSSYWRLNVLFTLFLGLVVIRIIKITSAKLVWFAATAACVIAADFLKTDYGAAGVLSIVMFYVFYNKMRKIVIAEVLLLLVFPLTVFILEVYFHRLFSAYYTDYILEPFGIFSLFIIAAYNKRKGGDTQYLFYYFYPFQYIVLLACNLILLFLPK